MTCFRIWVLLPLCLLVIWGSFQLDAPVREQIVASQGKSWKKSASYRFYSAVRIYGDWPYLMVGSLVALGVAKLRKSRRWMRIILLAMLASTLAGVVANASRLTTGRTRPREKIEQGFYGLRHDEEWLIGKSGFNSFPSGHTATAFGLAGVIFFASPLVGIVAIAGAALVAWSSIIIGAHHPSDVTVSILLSLVIARLIWRNADAVCHVINGNLELLRGALRRRKKSFKK